MPDKLDPRNWFAALQWAQVNASQLGLYFYSPRENHDYFNLHNKESVLEADFAALLFDAELKKPEPLLYRIKFNGPEADVRWIHSQGDFPENLEDLIATGRIEGIKAKGSQSAHRKRLEAVARANPGLIQAYTAIYRILFPPLERWGLHTGSEEYVETIARDKAILARLKQTLN